MKLIYNNMTGWDLGLYTWEHKRYGPFMWYKEMLTFDGELPKISGWKFAIFLSKAAIYEFYEGLCK